MLHGPGAQFDVKRDVLRMSQETGVECPRSWLTRSGSPNRDAGTLFFFPRMQTSCQSLIQATNFLIVSPFPKISSIFSGLHFSVHNWTSPWWFRTRTSISDAMPPGDLFFDDAPTLGLLWSGVIRSGVIRSETIKSGVWLAAWPRGYNLKNSSCDRIRIDVALIFVPSGLNPSRSSDAFLYLFPSSTERPSSSWYPWSKKSVLPLTAVVIWPPFWGNNIHFDWYFDIRVDRWMYNGKSSIVRIFCQMVHSTRIYWSIFWSLILSRINLCWT